MKDYIVDSSVIAKCFLPEAGSDRAQLLIKTDSYLRAPDLILPEFSNVLAKRIVRKEITIGEARALLGRFLSDYVDARVHLIPSRLVAGRALEIAHKEGRSIHDSLFLALAVQARCQLITADEELINGIRDKNLKRHLISLHDSALTPVLG